MGAITFISTLHKGIGKCNADELCRIFEQINPEVIFLEALNETYSRYKELLFRSYGIFDEKLEIEAIQKYSLNHDFEYIPVLENGLKESFRRKNDIVCKDAKLRKLIDHYNLIASEEGFEFLNSDESVKLEDEMRKVENEILNDTQFQNEVKNDIDLYENSMLDKIYAHCEDNIFNSAIFMCGVAHRKSIIEKINNRIINEDVTWKIFGNSVQT